ncbi:MAG: cryptochrome/photolyase family protein [Glaciecola sp.]|jgi:deoxyribodipyrimidine photolyase-related protein|nr:cryptochrome/photolyase family protein [Glaciecola sp.]MDG1814784.1 cryptochrome/photolyase family protein [Glaciecola sp.]MDG2098929.1 cryptochrome/photolyase family protein [Glaciecola sp.]
MPASKTLRLILADQLTHSVSALDGIDVDNDVILLAEVRSEASYVKHHKKKIIYLFSAMRHFARELQQKGYQVHYTYYDAQDNQGSLAAEVAQRLTQYGCDKVVCTFPGEYRVHQDMLSWSNSLTCPVEIRADNRFIATIEEFATWADGKKQLRMEFFYREMRRKLDCLLHDGQPEGGKWNYDADNRAKLPKDIQLPQNTQFAPDAITLEVIELVKTHFGDHFGDWGNFHYGVTREQALIVLDTFINERLINFGQYQDAMMQDEPWLFHSHISFYLNSGLLTAYEVVARVEQVYYVHAQDPTLPQIPLNSVEGFIRQVIGWREYVRGLYWFVMPDYVNKNHLNATRKLPEFFWTGKTKMNCMAQCIKDTKEHAYAHHIQRLMVLGNFALLTGLSPEEVNEWYLIVYGDAYEWVELPNVSGMVLYADGGVLASKPYAASGAYINKMSNYCKHCEYKVTVKTGEGACPFNYLYWDFLYRHREVLSNNHRMGMIYRTMDKMAPEKLDAAIADANTFLISLDAAE